MRIQWVDTVHIGLSLITSREVVSLGGSTKQSGHRSILSASLFKTRKRDAPMTQQELDLSAFAHRAHDRPDLVAEMVTFLYQGLIDAEATEYIAAERNIATPAFSDPSGGSVRREGTFRVR